MTVRPLLGGPVRLGPEALRGTVVYEAPTFLGGKCSARGGGRRGAPLHRLWKGVLAEGQDRCRSARAPPPSKPGDRRWLTDHYWAQPNQRLGWWPEWKAGLGPPLVKRREQGVEPAARTCGLTQRKARGRILTQAGGRGFACWPQISLTGTGAFILRAAGTTNGGLGPADRILFPIWTVFSGACSIALFENRKQRPPKPNWGGGPPRE